MRNIIKQHQNHIFRLRGPSKQVGDMFKFIWIVFRRRRRRRRRRKRKVYSKEEEEEEEEEEEALECTKTSARMNVYTSGSLCLDACVSADLHAALVCGSRALLSWYCMPPRMRESDESERARERARARARERA